MSSKKELHPYPVHSQEWLFAGIVFLLSIIGYIYTLAPTVSFWDAGEFIACAHSLGVPHPPGTPLYVLIGKVFSLIPAFGLATVTQKINFMSAFFSAIAVALLFLIIVRLVKEWSSELTTTTDRLMIYIPAAVGSLIAAFSFSYWNNAIESEVYALAMFIMAASVWLAFSWYDNFGAHGNNNKLLLIAFMLSLGVGNHLLCFLVAPGIFLMVAFKDWRVALDTVVMGFFVFLIINLLLLSVGLSADMYPIWMIIFVIVLSGLLIYFMWPHPNFKFIIAGVVLFLLGLSVHAYLPIRSMWNPLIDEGNPETWQGLMDVLLRKQYGQLSILDRRATLGFQIALWWEYFTWQYGALAAKAADSMLARFLPLPIFLIGIFGAWWHYINNKKSFVVFFIHFFITSFGLIIYLNLSDAEVRDRDYFYVAGYYFFAVWVAVGIKGIADLVKAWVASSVPEDSNFVRWTIVMGSVFLIAIPVFGNYTRTTRANNYVPRDYGYNILASVDENGLIFTNGDNDTFPLWYMQAVENFRTDVTVMNLSLLNTPWYIKQLRDNPPHNLKGIITWKDQDIDEMRPFLLPNDFTFQAGQIVCDFEKDAVITVKDLAVLHIIKNNWDPVKQDWKKPIFFAVTVADLMGFRPYLSLEGLVFRITQTKGDYMVTVDKTIENLEEKYQFTHLFDGKTHLDDNTKKLLSNYAAAYSRLAFEFHDQADSLEKVNPEEARLKLDDAVHWMQKAVQFAPFNQTGKLLWRSYGALLERADRYPEAIAAYQKSIATDDDINSVAQTWQLISKSYYLNGDMNSAIQAIEEAQRLRPNDQNLNVYRQLYEQELKRSQKPAAVDSPGTDQ